MDRRAAKQHWLTRTGEWRKWAEALIVEIQNIEDPAFRHCVAGLLDACASGCGHVLVRRQNETKISFVRIALDPEVTAALERGVKSLNEEADFPKLLEQADAWLKTRLKLTNALQVAWTIGPLRDINPYEKDSLKTIAMDHIVYDVKNGKFLGVRYDGDGLYKV
jgi:hypothetical protein